MTFSEMPSDMRWKTWKSPVPRVWWSKSFFCWEEVAGETDNVDHTDVLGVSTSDGVEGGKFTDTKGGDQDTETVDTGVTVSGVTGIELIGVTDPTETLNFIDLIQKRKVEVTWNTKDGGDSELLDTVKEVVTDSDGHGSYNIL